MNINTVCPRCGFGEDYLQPSIENEVSYYYCLNCGHRFIVNDQDGGSKHLQTTTTKTPGIEFVVPPGSSEMDINLLKTLNELNTQTIENQRYDHNAEADLHKALYGTTKQSGAGNGGKKKCKKNIRKKKIKNKKRKTLTSKKRKYSLQRLQKGGKTKQKSKNVGLRSKKLRIKSKNVQIKSKICKICKRKYRIYI